jgi:hypothetical protein
MQKEAEKFGCRKSGGEEDKQLPEPLGNGGCFRLHGKGFNRAGERRNVGGRE